MLCNLIINAIVLLEKILLFSSPNPKSDFNPSNFKMKEDQPKYSVNFNPAKTASAMNPLAGNKQKTNHKEETKSINEIVSKELSMISDEVSCFCLL